MTVPNHLPDELPSVAPSRMELLNRFLVCSTALLKEMVKTELEHVPLIRGAIATMDEFQRQARDAEMMEYVRANKAVSIDILTSITGLQGVLESYTKQDVRQIADFAARQQMQVSLEELEAGQQELALVAYRTQIAYELAYVDYRAVGPYDADPEVSLPLDDVFVEPRLAPEEFRRTTDEERALEQLLADPTADEEEKDRAWQRYVELTGAPPGTWGWVTTTIPLGKALAAFEPIVLLGGPGAGKSIITKYLARACVVPKPPASPLPDLPSIMTPVRVELSAYADASRGRADLSLKDFAQEVLRKRGGNVLVATMEAEATERRILFLLDGVDEERDHDLRRKLARAVDRFLDQFRGCPAIVTSRPAGYVRLTGPLRHFTLVPFSADQQQEFARGWRRAREMRRHQKAPNFKAAEREAERDLTALRANPRVQELASNPLILIMCLFLRSAGTKLPEQRVELYGRVVQLLLGAWNAMRSDLEVEGAKLDDADLLRVLAGVALWMRSAHQTGMVHRNELIAQIARVLVVLELDDEHPEKTARAYLDAVTKRSGLMEERAADVFAFWHQSFEEYLAAVQLTLPTADCIQALLPLRDDQSWREVILLAVSNLGRISPESAGDLLLALVKNDLPNDEPVSHRMLRLGADCLADGPKVLRSKAESVLQELVRAMLAHPTKRLAEAFVDAYRGQLELVPRDAETIRLLMEATNHADERVRVFACRLLGRASGRDEQVAAQCWRLAETDTSGWVRFQAIFPLLSARLMSTAQAEQIIASISGIPRVWLGSPEDPVLGELARLLSSTDERVRFRVAGALLPTTYAVDAARVLLGIATSQDAGLRSGALDLFGRYQLPSETVVDAAHVLKLCRPDAQCRIAELLLGTDQADAARSALDELLVDSEPTVRLSAARLCNREGSAKASATLAGLLQEDDPRIVLESAKLCVDSAHQANAVRALANLRLSDDSAIQTEANQALVGALREERVIEQLQQVLSEGDAGVRLAVAELIFTYLGYLGDRSKPERLIASARSNLQDLMERAEPSIRFRAARALHTADGDAAASRTLVRLMSVGEESVRLQAAELLFDGPEHLAALPVLLELLTQAGLETQVQAGLTLLWTIEATDQAIHSLVKSLASDSPGLRYRAASGLLLTPRAVDAARVLVDLTDTTDENIAADSVRVLVGLIGVDPTTRLPNPFLTFSGHRQSAGWRNVPRFEWDSSGVEAAVFDPLCDGDRESAQRSANGYRALIEHRAPERGDAELLAHTLGWRADGPLNRLRMGLLEHLEDLREQHGPSRTIRNVLPRTAKLR